MASPQIPSERDRLLPTPAGQTSYNAPTTFSAQKPGDASPETDVETAGAAKHADDPLALSKSKKWSILIGAWLAMFLAVRRRLSALWTLSQS